MLYSISEIISTSWNLYIRDWRKFLPVMLVLFLPTPVWTVLFIAGFYLNHITLFFSAITTMAAIIILPLLGLIYGWGILTLTRLAHSAITGENITPGRAFGLTVRRLWPAAYTMLIVIILLIIGTLLFVFPAIIFSVWYWFVIPAIVIDNQKGFGALGYSHRLVSGRWFAIAWRLIAPLIVFGILGIILKVGLTFILTGFVTTPYFIALIENHVVSLVSALLTPLTILATLIVYENAKAQPIIAPNPK